MIPPIDIPAKYHFYAPSPYPKSVIARPNSAIFTEFERYGD
jgi:hypothetical protein